MKFAICVKHVPVSDDVEVDAETHRVRRANAQCDINACDLNALEMAVQLKKASGATLDVFSMGPDGARASLKKCLALGADEAYLLSDRQFAGGDTLATARILSYFLAKQGPYDAVFMGAEASDGATSQVGPMTAAFLGIPDVIDAVAAEVDNQSENSLLLHQRTAQGVLQLQASMPVLLTVPFGCNQPALPTLRMQMKANRREIHVLTASDMPAEIVSQLTAKSVVTDVYPAPVCPQAKRLEGTATKIARQIRQIIREARDKHV